MSEISLTYLPGNATRIVAKAVGDFNLGDADTQSSVGGVAVDTSDTSAMTSVDAATAAAASSQQGEYASAEARDADEFE